MSNIVIKNAYVVNPVNNYLSVRDIEIIDGYVSKIAANISGSEHIINADGLIAGPGLIDMHVHLRDPGQKYKEDIKTGLAAAISGGFTAVACMPNTSPPCDSVTTIKYMLDQAKGCHCDIYPYACVTKGLKGERLVEFDKLKKAGAVGFSDDGRPVENAKLMLEAMLAANKVGARVYSHCEDFSLACDGIINDGIISHQLGIKGIPNVAEDVMVARDIALSAQYNLPVHICHISTKGSTELVRDAKARGVRVTCETAPHYFTLNQSRLISKDADYRMNPPLRTAEDVKAIISAVKDGTIDAIATDHAPHTAAEKADFLTAPNGVIGLETSMAITFNRLVETKTITLTQMFNLLSVNPAKILDIPGGDISAGKPADIVLFDPLHVWTVEKEKMLSKSKNTPFKSMKLTGKVMYTIKNGEVVYSLKNND